MSEDEANALAVEISRTTGHDVEVLAEDDFFLVEVRRAVPGDSWTLRDEQDWQAFGQRIRTTE
jgi:16S rRNA U1498 N3-methylase RsmE